MKIVDKGGMRSETDRRQLLSPIIKKRTAMLGEEAVNENRGRDN